ncbi:hypothetical protein LJR143_000568 [Pseudoxanthomonas sp. LjRoot143]|uniref:hypothetical protein n=1 Tax=Pseudoxanthomonas sp. LjRoot143 TaxID=3342266 RepID=UPI003ECF7A59
MDEVAIGMAVDAMYAMISGPAGPRDWSTQEAVFHPDCRQIRTGVDAEGKPWRLSFTLAEYRTNADELLAKMDFFEVETAREMRVFGNIAHVWSAYEARTAPDDAVPERRGINSIQLYKGEDGWKIIHMIWDNERDGVPLPAVG